MRPLSSLAAALILLAAPALAEQKPVSHAKPGPLAIGTYEDWTAATNREAGTTICYAFTRARDSKPALPGRDDVVLTVTERPTMRDAVAISAGYTYPANAVGKLVIDKDTFDLYTSQRSAFARDGHAAARAMERGREAVSHAPGPKGPEVADTFSLRGFTAAYDAIQKRCPAGKPSS